MMRRQPIAAAQPLDDRRLAPPGGGSGGRATDGLARSSLASLAGGAANAVLGFGLVLVVSRGLGAATAGVFFAVVAVATILGNAVELGADTGLVREVSRFRAQDRVAEMRQLVRVAALPVVVAGLAVAVLTAVFADRIASLVVADQPEVAADLLRVVAVAIPASALATTLLAGTRGFGTVLPLVAVQNVGIPLGRLIGAAVAVVAGLGGVALAASWMVPVVLAMVAAVVVVRHLLARDAGDSRAPLAAGATRSFWQFSGPRGVAGMIEISTIWFGVLVLSSLSTAQNAGVYAAVSRYVLAGTLVVQALRIALAPKMAALLALADVRGAGEVQRTGAAWTVLGSWPIYVVLALFPGTLLGLFGAEFRDGAAALTILAVGMLTTLASGTSHTLLLMAGRSGLNLVDRVVALALQVLLGVLLVPSYGLVGAAVAATVGSVAGNALALVQARRLVGTGPIGRETGLAALVSLACFAGPGLLARAVLGDTVAGACVAVAAGCIAYGPIVVRHRGALCVGFGGGLFSNRIGRRR